MYGHDTAGVVAVVVLGIVVHAVAEERPEGLRQRPQLWVFALLIGSWFVWMLRIVRRRYQHRVDLDRVREGEVLEHLSQRIHPPRLRYCLCLFRCWVCRRREEEQYDHAFELGEGGDVTGVPANTRRHRSLGRQTVFLQGLEIKAQHCRGGVGITTCVLVRRWRQNKSQTSLKQSNVVGLEDPFSRCIQGQVKTVVPQDRASTLPMLRESPGRRNRCHGSSVVAVVGAVSVVVATQKSERIDFFPHVRSIGSRSTYFFVFGRGGRRRAPGPGKPVRRH